MTAFLITHLVIAALAIALNVAAAILNPQVAARSAVTICAILPMAGWALWLLAKGVAQ